MSLYKSLDEKTAKRDETKKKVENQVDTVKRMAGECFQTPQGQYILNYLMRYCGFERCSSVVSGTTGEVLPLSSAFRDGQRDVYVCLRELLKDKNSELLKEIEFKKY